jgi:putative DNA primase/helicase
LVAAQEVDENRQWATSRIKALTGDDEIPARFMHKDFFRFTPQCKLLIAGNNKPSLPSADEAIRRRFHLIPFTVTIPKEKRDPDLSEKLKTEWPGILRWMINGYIEYQLRRLEPAQCVIEATRGYLEIEDSVSQRLVDDCDRSEVARATGAELYTSWQKWCGLCRQQPGNNKTLYERLEKLGFRRVNLHGSAAFKGIKVKPQPTGER